MSFIRKMVKTAIAVNKHQKQQQKKQAKSGVAPINNQSQGSYSPIYQAFLAQGFEVLQDTEDGILLIKKKKINWPLAIIASLTFIGLFIYAFYYMQILKDEIIKIDKHGNVTNM